MTTGRHYKITDDRFGRQALTLREKARLTQHEVAVALGVSERTIRYWEDGTTFPTGANLKQLIALYLRAGVFAVGQERDEAQAFWDQADASAVRRKSLFDEAWFDHLLGQAPADSPPDERTPSADTTGPTPRLLAQADWGEAPDITLVCGREQELSTLARWVGTDRARVLVLLGLGGIGKTTLGLRLAQVLAPQFDRVIWRSLHDAPPPEEFLGGLLHSLGAPPAPPATLRVEPTISTLLNFLRQQRCLLVLDNVESLLEPGNLAGRYREGYEGYPLLFKRVAQTAHQSCLLLTSREMLSELEPFTGTQSPVRTLHLAGLARSASQELLFDKDLFDTSRTWDRFVEHYVGNPLALKAQPQQVQGYAGGNLANLLVCLSGHLRGVDLSGLALRQVYLQGIDAQGASLAGASIYDTRFTEPIETIVSMMLSPDGAYLAIGSFSGEVRVWRVENVRPVWSARGHPRMAWALAYSPDSRILASCGYDGNIRLWDAVTGRRRAVYAASPSPLRALAFSPVEPLLGSAGDDGTVRLWDIRDGTCRLALPGHHGPIWSLTFDPAGDLLVTGGIDGTVRVWDPHTGACVRVLQRHSSGIFTVAFHPHSAMVACGAEDGQISLWNAWNGERLATLHRNASGLAALAFNPEGTLLASGSNQGVVELWRIAGGHPYPLLSILHDRAALVSAVAFGPEGRLASVARAGQVKLWDAPSGKLLRTIQGYSRLITALSFSPDGNLLAQGSDNGILRIWDVCSGQCIHVIEEHRGPIWAIAWHPDGTIFASAGDHGDVKLWAAQRGRCLRSLESQQTVIWTLSFSPDGTVLAAAGVDKVITLWQIEGRAEDTPVAVLGASGDQVVSLAFSADGQLLTSGHRDGELRLWSWADGTLRRTLQRDAGPVVALLLSTDAQTLISCSNNDRLEWWDLASGRCLKGVQVDHSGSWVRGTAFSQDGALLAIAGDDQTVKVWAVEGPGAEGQLTSFTGHEGEVWTVALSADHRLLASGDDAGVVILWDTHTGAELRRLRTERPYEQMNIQGIMGITEVQHEALIALGATEAGEDPPA